MRYEIEFKLFEHDISIAINSGYWDCGIQYTRLRETRQYCSFASIIFFCVIIGVVAQVNLPWRYK